VNGLHKNPQTVKLPGAEPLRAESMGRFLSESAPLLSRLEPPAAPAAAANVPVIGTAQSRAPISAN
jgi:hypothetical protein